MRNMLLIARREYLEQIRSRAFRMSTIGLPAIFALVILIIHLSSLGLGSGRHMAVAGDDPRLAQDVRARILADTDAKATVDVHSPAAPQERAALISEVQNRSLDSFLWLESVPGALPKATYYAQSSADFITSTRLLSKLDDSIVDVHLTTAGVKAADADAIVKGVSMATFQVKKDGRVVKSNAQISFWKGYVMAFLLSMTTMIYGMNVARSIIQEKTSRIFEVMLATAEPGDLLAGKLVGAGAVGLTQIGIWLAASAVLIPFAVTVLPAQYAIEFSWAEVVLFPVYFVLGYLLYSALFAGLAATCETEQELQMYMPLAAVPVWLSFSLILLIMNDSNSVWSVAASLFPPTAPIIMFLRMASEMPPAWQFAASIGLMVLSIWGVLWVGSRLYRVGILMYGKRATLPELMRWLRYS